MQVNTYDVYRNGSRIAQSNPSNEWPVFTNTSVTAGTTYSYYVVNKNAYGSTNSSNTISVTALTCGGSAPVPFTVYGTPQCNGSSPQILLSGWSTNAGETYDVYRNGSRIAQANPSNDWPVFTNTSVTAGTTYSYYVVNKNAYGSTNSSNTISVTALTCGGSAPVPFTVYGTPQCNGSSPQILLSGWSTNAGETYDVYRNGSRIAQANPSNDWPVFTNTSVTAGTTYSYYVVNKNAYGSTNSSNTISVTAPTCGGSAPVPFTVYGTPQCNGSSPQILLSGWSTNAGETYDVYRNGSRIAQANPSNDWPVFTNTSVTAGTTYSYYVVNKNAYGSRTSNNTVAVTAPTCY